MELKSNADLYNLVKAKAGVRSFQTQEDAHLLAFLNHRLFEAYKSHRAWPRYLVAGEPRTIANLIIDYTQDGRHVFGAGTEAVNGLYVLNGTQNSAAAYTLYDSDGTTENYSLIYSGSGTTWNLIAGAPDSGGATQYTNTDSGNTTDSSSPTISETGWTVSSGTAPAPTVRDLARIYEPIKVHRREPFRRASGTEYKFYADSLGIHALNTITSEDSVVYVTYNKAPPTATDFDANTASSVAEIPEEWFDFLGEAIYADFLEMDGQTEKAQASEYKAAKLLAFALERADSQSNINMVHTKITTHLTYHNR